MKYIVYQTINKINNKIYVGVHKTENPDIFDGYLGCGAYVNQPSTYNKTNYHLHNAILKYGPKNFYRITLKIFDTPKEAFNLEKEIVNEEFIKRSDTYNMTLGGYIPPLQNKRIYQFDINGNILKTWNSIKEITKYYNCNKDRITMCIKDKRSFNNNYWSETEIINIDEYHLSAREAVFQYNSDGILLNSFKNVTEAAQKLDLDKQAINCAIYGKHRCSGYYFLHSDDDINFIINAQNNRKLKNQTPVYRYLENGSFDKEYISLSSAAKENNTSTGNIIRAIKNESLCMKYKWSYDKDIKFHSYRKKEIIPVKIAQYTVEGKLIKIWDTITSCQKEFPACRRVCNGTRKTTGGYVFKYVE
jgi:hypothetical protein